VQCASRAPEGVATAGDCAGLCHAVCTAGVEYVRQGARRDCVSWALGKGFVRSLLMRAVTAVFVST
jgi:hypothetical protein